MKKSISFFLLFPLLFSFSFTAVSAKAAETISGECAVLIEATSRRVLFEKNANRRHPMASTTKIMTALVALEALPLDSVISVPEEATGIEGSSVYLKAGDRYRLEDLLYALLLQSANDAAEVIAIAVSGTVEAFAVRMNEKAKELALTDTHFENPHGLDGDEHYTTARELAIITAHALENSDFAKIVSTRRYVFSSLDGANPRTLINHNKMLLLYEGAVGVKTGYTKRCGRCLVSAAEREGLLLIAVTLDAPSDWHDHTALLDYGFDSYENRLLASQGSLSLEVPIFNHATTVRVVNRDAIYMVLPRDAASPEPKIELLPPPIAPIKLGDIAGSITYTDSDGRSVTSPLIFSESISLPHKTKGRFGLGR